MELYREYEYEVSEITRLQKGRFISKYYLLF
jgi:hypothetical protein